jgi:hypothetical protein
VVSTVPIPLSSFVPAAFILRLDSDNQPIPDPSYAEYKDTYQLFAANALGEGCINVCGEGGNIAVGDFIVCSGTTGKGMKQTDDVLHSYTVARAREAATFSGPTDILQIACIYVCG